MKPLTESDTRAKLIDPALHKKGWREDLIRREETECGIDIIDGKPRRRERGRIDYLLRVKVNISTQPVAIALIEAKKSNEPPDKGLEQAKKYARLNYVPFVYSSNGHLFVEYNHFTGKTVGPHPLEEFPIPEILRKRYEQRSGFSLESETAKPLLALARQFEMGGTEELENPYVFNTPDVIKAGGLEALKILGEPKDIINETKEKLFSV